MFLADPLVALHSGPGDRFLPDVGKSRCLVIAQCPLTLFVSIVVLRGSSVLNSHVFVIFSLLPALADPTLPCH
jgi:hypothetical protein